MPKKPQQTKSDYKIKHTYSNNDTKLSDIIHSKQFVESIYKLIVKYS
jgi:hypothetical protein